ncbi:hypothetical protein EJB05_24438, partial [Eragrostis curvula]
MAYWWWGMEQESEIMRVNKPSSSSWVVKMEHMLEDAVPSVEMARWKQHSIYRVPEFIKKLTNGSAYQPQFVSLGPLHHGEDNLRSMEEHKRRAVLHMVNRAGKPLGKFIAAIEEIADELEKAYDDLDDKWRGSNRSRFVEIMVTDGCFLLEVMMRGDEDYAVNDPVFSARSIGIFWPALRNDMIALENQLPLIVLQRLLTVQRGTDQSANTINSLVLSFLGRPLEDQMDNLGLHMLDVYHKSYCCGRPQWERSENCEALMPCATELNMAGIEFKKSKTKSIHDIGFENGVLSMPLFETGDSTEVKFLNLMAFEWLHPDAECDVVSYIYFWDQLIDFERDVALLRNEGVFANMIGSDKKAVHMFNTLTKLTWPNKDNRLGYVQWKVNAHCRKRRNKWRASFVSTYLSNPWVFISLVAAVILLVATLLQTLYTIVPFYTRA